MSFFERWLGASTTEWVQPNIRFGRYSDSYKDSLSYDAWDKALDIFEENRFLDSLELFFQFLQDKEEDNVHWQRSDDRIAFEFFQGSKRIIGWATATHLRIEGRIGRMLNAGPELLRRMVEANYNLKFSRYALDPSEFITVVFDTSATDASPYKLYYAFKEVATHADKQDDLLLEEYGKMEAVDNSHLEPLSALETKVKHQFIINNIKNTLALVKEQKLNKYAGAVSYLLLNLIYKIDYLCKPEGFTMETLERMHRQFFAKETALTPEEKNQALIHEFTKLLARSEQDYSQEMYHIKTTFGITSSVTHDRLIHLINNELNDMDWYIANGYPKVALAIPSYLVGYSLFNYAIPQPDRDFFHLFYRAIESDYFKALGYKPDLYDHKTGQVNRKHLKKAINQIVKKHSHRYPNLRPAISQLVFDNILDFSKSYLLMVRDLDLSRID